MIKLVEIELKKLNLKALIIPLTIIPVLSIVFGAINYNLNREILQHEWISLWTQVYLFYGLFFLPAIIGIIVAFIWHKEHNNMNFKLLLTLPTHLYKIVIAKMIVAMAIVAALQLYFFILFFAIGQYFSFNMSFPITLVVYLMFTSVVSMSFIGLQGYLSIKINSFAVPVGIAFLIGLISLYVDSQSLVPMLKNVVALSNLTFKMNHYPEITLGFNEGLMMFIVTFCLTVVCLILQIKAMKSKF